jgi:nucleoside-diphosphate-sugar epimerase
VHVIVTGGAGFVGSNVAASYLRDGHRVTVFDSLRRRSRSRARNRILHRSLWLSQGA